ncbi:hypothetical protein M432DRAFT_613499 [Thermoascus aurantiacus ATCC 26904]
MLSSCSSSFCFFFFCFLVLYFLAWSRLVRSWTGHFLGLGLACSCFLLADDGDDELAGLTEVTQKKGLWAHLKIGEALIDRLFYRLQALKIKKLRVIDK